MAGALLELREANFYGNTCLVGTFIHILYMDGILQVSSLFVVNERRYFSSWQLCKWVPWNLFFFSLSFLANTRLAPVDPSIWRKNVVGSIVHVTGYEVTSHRILKIKILIYLSIIHKFNIYEMVSLCIRRIMWFCFKNKWLNFIDFSISQNLCVTK